MSTINPQEAIDVLQKSDAKSLIASSKKRFTELARYQTGNQLTAEAKFEMEQKHFMTLLESSPKLKNCDRLSLYMTFMIASTNNLSFDPTMKEMYVIPRGNKAVPSIQAMGELKLRLAAGQIKHVDSPIIVIEGDIFKPKLNANGEKVVEWEKKIPNASTKIIACFIRIVKTNGAVDYEWMLEDDIERLKGFSKRNNGGAGANALYSSHNGGVDPGFLRTKMIKHAFKAYPSAPVIAPKTLSIAFESDKETPDAEAAPKSNDDMFGTVEQVAEILSSTPLNNNSDASEATAPTMF
jgi:recombinational DNA repair protein RecT